MNAELSVLGLYNYDASIFDNMSYPDGFTTQDKTDFVDNLLMELAELEVIYTDPAFFKMAVAKWSKKEATTWNRIYTAAQLEYNPIENYDRQESETEVTDGSRQHSGTDTVTNSGTDTVTNSGKDTTQDSGSDSSSGTGSRTTNNTGTDTTTNQIAAYDSNTLVTHDTSALLHGHSISDSTTDSTTVTHGKKSELTHGHVEATQHGLQSATLHGEKIEDDISRNKISRIHGNIGVTTSQQMLTQEIEVAPKLNIMNYMIDSFKNRFCVLVW